ncbi:MAG: hypothetical protein Q9182_003467 [Xanthomendoza sp. 2 TL-2023]
MDFALRCNNLKCRAQLTEQAVVTTSCETSLPNLDDAVSTQLNPTEDYKTSVLSGLSPSTIVECAGRGLAFWSYQSTQEIVYQEYLAKSLTDKYNNLGIQVDKIIHDANTEIKTLNQKLANKSRLLRLPCISLILSAGSQIDREKLQSENTNLVQAFREKSRKHQQTQELYDRLKRKEMAATAQSAAFESVDDVLGHVSSRTGQGPNNNPTPSHHRTQLGSRTQNNIQQGTGGGNRNASHVGSGLSQVPTPSQRLPLGTTGASSINRPMFGGYGMSAGLKVGRQQESPPWHCLSGTWNVQFLRGLSA